MKHCRQLIKLCGKMSAHASLTLARDRITLALTVHETRPAVCHCGMPQAFDKATALTLRMPVAAGAPAELVDHFDACQPLLVGGLAQGEDKVSLHLCAHLFAETRLRILSR